MTARSTAKQDTRDKKQLRGIGRAFGGAIIFSLPMLMTLEFWVLGFTMSPVRLLVFLVVALPVLAVLSHQIGFEKTPRLSDDILDTALALLIGSVVALTVLTVFGALSPDMSLREIVGKVAIQTVPAAIGALLGRSQFGSNGDEAPQDREETYRGELFLMAVGALFLSLSMAPTEEIRLIAFRMSAWHALAITLISLLIVHGFVFAVGFRGGSRIDPAKPWWTELLRFTVPGYLLALAVSFYVLWTFHSLDDLPLRLLIFHAIVLGLPASVGAAAARLIL